MRAGKMRHRITLQKSEPIRGRLGEVSYKYRDVADVWADIRAVSAKEYIQMGVKNVEIDIRVYIRYRPDIERGDRIVHKSTNTPGGAFIVKAILPNARMNMLELLCAGVE
ncbi:head-tail adaptor [Salmonella enterica subsp. enterica serovar Enteritidis]|nr:head-tail adaptor protein [Salmonella enterica subsp. enterica serovar Enteritidis]EBK2664098.1 head-tail adaptor [Salmonella enterica subsp. enterica serovar Enteritidis]EJK8885143.1 phage head closure protein [Salmonella enterica]